MNVDTVIYIIASSTVAVVGILSPILLHRSDRTHEIKLLVREKREMAYASLLKLMADFKNFDKETIFSTLHQVAIPVRLLGSREVRLLFQNWIEIYPSSIGPNVSAGTRDVVDAAESRLIERMADEVQGRVD